MTPKKDPNLVGPGERLIEYDPVSGRLHSSDFAPFSKATGGTQYVQDVIDPDIDRDFYQVMSAAMGRPGTPVESDIGFRGAQVRVRIIYSDKPEPRVRVFVSPRN